MAARPQRPLALDHVVFEVRDVEKSSAFYEKILRLPPVRLEEFRAGKAPFASARVNSETLLDFFPASMWRIRRRASNPNHVCLALTTGEIVALKRRLAKNRIPITHRLRRSYGARGYASSIYFNDPDGIEIEARRYSASRHRAK